MHQPAASGHGTSPCMSAAALPGMPVVPCHPPAAGGCMTSEMPVSLPEQQDLCAGSPEGMVGVWRAVLLPGLLHEGR